MSSMRLLELLSRIEALEKDLGNLRRTIAVAVTEAPDAFKFFGVRKVSLTEQNVSDIVRAWETNHDIINPIKNVRDMLGIGLKEAKDLVENTLYEHSQTYRELRPRP